MPGAHRVTDSRACGAVTSGSSQGTVFVNNKLWAVEGDPNSHGGGNLICVYGPKNIYIEGKHVIVAPGDLAGGDAALHPSPFPRPAGASGDVIAYNAEVSGDVSAISSE